MAAIQVPPPEETTDKARLARIGRRVRERLADNKDVNILVTSASETMPFAPDIPTMKDLGFETSLSYLNIIVGPAGMPDEVKQKLVDAHKQAYAKYKAEIDEGLLKLEQTPVLMEGDEVAHLMAQREKWFVELAPQMGAAQ